MSACLIFGMNIISADVRKILVLAFVHFRRGWIEALIKKLLEHFTATFNTAAYV